MNLPLEEGCALALAQKLPRRARDHQRMGPRPWLAGESDDAHAHEEEKGPKER